MSLLAMDDLVKRLLTKAKEEYAAHERVLLAEDYAGHHHVAGSTFEAGALVVGALRVLYLELRTPPWSGGMR